MRYRVLHIENDRKLTDSLKECADEKLRELSRNVEIDFVVARHIQQANDLLDANDPPLDALIVDLMLPRNEDDLTELERLERQRAETVRKRFRRATYDAAVVDEETVSLTEDIRRLDREIEPHVAPEGGCEILARLAERLDLDRKTDSDPKPLFLPTIFLTARGLPEVKKRCAKLVAARSSRFLEKPVWEDDVLRALLELLGASPH